MMDIITDLWNTHGDFILALGRKASLALAIAAAGYIIVKVSGRLIRRITAKIPRFDETFSALLRIALNYTIFIVCIIMVLDIFGINTTSLIALLGAAGVAVGLALKDTLGNIAAGIILIFLRSYRKGDLVEFGSYLGTVKEMNLFTTILETPEGIFISAPNSSIWGTPLKNYTHNHKRRMDLAVMVAYSDPLDTAFAVLHAIATEEPRFLTHPAPQVIVQSLGDNGVNLILRVWAHTDVYSALYGEKLRLIKERIQAAGLTIPFPQTDVRIL